MPTNTETCICGAPKKLTHALCGTCRTNKSRATKKAKAGDVCKQCLTRKPLKGKTWCKACRDVRQAWEDARAPERRDKHRQRHQRLRGLVNRGYGGMCKCCGEDYQPFLQVDHVHNDGARDRQTRAGTKLLTYLIREGYPEGYQLLCANCNMRKHTAGGRCDCPRSRLQNV